MKQLRHIWLIALKDLKLFATDRLALFFFILFPFLFVVMFNFMLGDIGSEDERLELHVATQEGPGGIISQQIIEALETRGDWEIIEIDYDKAHRAVEDKEIAGFLAFPADFTEGVLTGSGAQIEVVADAEDINTRAALHGLAQAIASQVGSQYVAISATNELLGGQTTQPPLPDQGGTATGESFIEFGIEKVGEVEPYNANNYLIPGYLVMFVFFAAALSAVTIVRERQNHTLERLLSSSVTRQSIVGGIFTGTAAKGLIQIAIFWAAGILIFNIDLGLSPAAVIILSVLMVIMSSAFGIMLATLVKTQRSADSIAVITALVLAPLGGCWWPLFFLPKWMQTLAKITPHGWANTGFNKLMLFGADFGAVVPEMLVLLGFAALFGLIAVWRFRTSAA
jgi:ABC-2 type transport system permease protein